jgi:caffeoyl-CoA O-methyltransferase
MSSDPIPLPISDYLDSLVPGRFPELEAMEAEARRTNFPIIGPASGHFCYLIARMIRARSIFELGSGFGYSTAWFARAILENGGGTVHHTVWDQGLSDQARRHLRALGLDHLIEYRLSEAVQALTEAPGHFDLIFCDIDKAGYPEALSVIEGKLRPGGILIADNLLWHGRIFDSSDQSKDTAGIREFTRRTTTGEVWTTSLVPIRDGLLVAQRR